MGAFFINENDIPEIRRSPWVDNFFRPLLIVIMIMCFNISLVNLVRLINPSWRGYYFLLGMLLTAIEAIYSYRVLRRWRSRGLSQLQYRLSEAIVLMIALKLLDFADKPLSRIWLELEAIWQSPLNILTIEFYIMLVLAMISWTAATFTIDDFEALYDPYTFRSDKILPLSDLLSRFFWGGILLVTISGISQIIARSGLSSLTDFRRPSIGGIILNVMIYFMLGLVLLSQANLTRLMVRWRVQKVSIAPGLVKQWAKYALVFLALMTGLVFFLPTGYTLGFLATVALVVQFLLNLFAFLVQLIIFLVALPFVWLFSLLSQTPVEQSVAPPPPPPQFDPPAPGAPLPWLELLRSIIFWLVTLAMVAYLVKVYLDDHPDVFDPLKKFKFINFILTLLQQLWGQFTNLAKTGLELLPRNVNLRQKRDSEALSQSPGWLGLRLSPRQRILYYYLNILKRVDEQRGGRRRKASQTPYEYEPDLSQTVPEAQTEVTDVTQAFVQARYSRTRFDKQQANAVKKQWQRIKQDLRRMKKK